MANTMKVKLKKTAKNVPFHVPRDLREFLPEGVLQPNGSGIFTGRKLTYHVDIRLSYFLLDKLGEMFE